MKETHESSHPETQPGQGSAPVPARPSAPNRQARHFRIITLAGVAVVIVAIMVLPRRPQPSGTASTDLEPVRSEQATDAAPGSETIVAAPIPSPAPVAAPAVVAPRAVSKTSKKPSAPKPVTSRPTSTKSSMPVAAAAAPRDAKDATTRLPSSEPVRASAPTSVSTASVSTANVPPPVTITGCLEISTDGDEFRLTDTDGVDVPKSRSWRTGFLKKRKAPVALVEAQD